MDPVAIHRAAEKGDLDKVQQLIEAGVSVDSRDNKGRTPLLLAAEWGQHAVVEFLINCKLHAENHHPPLLLDMDVENEVAIGLFLQHDEENSTLLHFASRYGWVDNAKTIIGKGLESVMVNAATSDGTTPLMEAALHGHEDIAALLLQSGADVNRRDFQGHTALHQATFEVNLRMVKLLLQEKGLDLSSQDVEGQTPLHLACYWVGHKEVIKQLLVAGAKANLINRYSLTPLTIYLNRANRDLEVINLFVQHGAYFQDGDYERISKNSVLRERVLKNVDLCTQSVINKFSYQTLPALYSSPYFARMLPSLDNLKLNTSQKDEVKNFVRRDIQQNIFCNVLRVRPTALSALCIQCLASYITGRK